MAYRLGMLIISLAIASGAPAKRLESGAAGGAGTAGLPAPDRFDARRGATERIAPRAKSVVQNKRYGNAYRLLDDPLGIASGSRFENIDATVLRGGFRFKGDAHDIVIRNATLRLAAPTAAPELPAGIELQGNAHDILIDSVTASGFQMIHREKRYTNGDGFSSERGAARIIFRNSTANDNSDGGFDLKSTDTRLENVSAARNGINYRFWGTGTGTRITSTDPAKAHLQINPGADWHINTLVVRSTERKPIIVVHGQGQLTIDRCELHVPAGTKMIRLDAKVTPDIHLGTGCTLP